MGMLREFLTDLKRKKQDNRTNLTVYNRVPDLDQWENLEEVRSQDLKVGDVIEISDGQICPADLLLLKTDEERSQCFVQTSQLDGERNLKPKFGLKYIEDNLRRLKKSSEKVKINCGDPT
mmetsp:Transcript_3804/g.3718  ORF Transcript_3804/g.3718 Transcript_3804/m.3718 type:complete len:120 (-) Transcript_3804:2534-2893(-)